MAAKATQINMNPAVWQPDINKASGVSPDRGLLVTIIRGNMVPDMNTDHSFSRAKDPDLVLGCRKVLSITQTQVAAWATNISLFLTAVESSIPLLSTVHKTFYFLSPVSPPYLFIIVVVCLPGLQGTRWAYPGNYFYYYNLVTMEELI